MNAFSEIEEKAMQMSESERATLASHLLHSLPAILEDDDDGLAEAQRRDAEMERDPSFGITTEQLRSSLGR